MAFLVCMFLAFFGVAFWGIVQALLDPVEGWATFRPIVIGIVLLVLCIAVFVWFESRFPRAFVVAKDIGAVVLALLILGLVLGQFFRDDPFGCTPSRFIGCD
jgi:hypothetical protein